MPQLPQIPQQTLLEMPAWFKSWWQDFTSKYLMNGIFTNGDSTLSIKGKGIVMTKAAGTVTKRVRLDDSGTGLIFEDV